MPAWVGQTEHWMLQLLLLLLLLNFPDTFSFTPALLLQQQF
jgi:hypothetical protein